MTTEEQAKMDAIADHLGEIYQRAGRLIHVNNVNGEDGPDLLDAILGACQDVEVLSDRKARAADDCH